ncbi:Acetyl-CoA carboxylase, carboxyltransferase component (Subunits alpha and beta) [Candidatus Promineifilum breve]|uniref:Acetyl-CoA carboxylase, carboxyltransferase component (Subunits alpha and beta) n=1 Tax=Candidatus Promineifilum breve TaxID=1806508 RepID=A0A170PE10_9CHLR|nr:carboxyl transferase domain-containing protein [Candidatus Promineifilum breve]CUS02307.2 Acetyl-CoA carboxylase, carboxyltransferase component (Subunits alpha and beta) [Candidatus Promineifilum breve]
MTELSSHINPNSEEFKANYAANKALAEQLADRQRAVATDRSPRSVELQRQRDKLLVRERIEVLLDDGSPFLELSPLAAWDMYDGEAPGAGIVTGIGRVSGVDCLIIANDPTVKGGTYFPETVKKHLRAQTIAEENRLTTIYLVDSGGAFLHLQADVFPDREHFGRIFYNIARLSAAGITQIAAVVGSCTAGGAYIPAMADETVIVRGNGTIFLAGPPLVRAATGEEVSAEDLGGGDVHTRISGVADHLADNEAEALDKVREIVSHLQPGLAARPRSVPLAAQTPEEPLYPADELYGVIPADPRHVYDVREVIARLVDGSRLSEFKARFGPTVVCGFAHIMGIPVGIVANNGLLFSEAALKATHFIQLCGQRGTPLLFMQNIAGFMVGRQYENEGIAKHGAKMVMAVSNVNVPRITLLHGVSHGAGNYGMSGRAYDPRFLFSWPNSRISVMSGDAAADTLWMVGKKQVFHQLDDPTDSEMRLAEEKFKRPILEQYGRESDPYFATARLWDDGILDPVKTRAALGLAFATTGHGPRAAGGYGTFRM